VELWTITEVLSYILYFRKSLEGTEVFCFRSCTHARMAITEVRTKDTVVSSSLLPKTAKYMGILYKG